MCLEKSKIMAQDTLNIYSITLVNGRLLFYLCVARFCVCVRACIPMYARIEYYMCLMSACVCRHMSSCTHFITRGRLQVS